MENIFGDVVYTYTRAQALADGTLVDLNQIIPVKESGFRYPVACTAAVWSMIDRAVKNKRWCNDLEGVVWDIISMARVAVVKRWETGQLFKVIISGLGRKSLYEMKIECGPGDAGEPVLTIMLPEED